MVNRWASAGAAIDLQKVHSVNGQMLMGIDEAWDQGPPPEGNHFGVPSRQRPDLLIPPYFLKAAVLDGHCPGP
jgi:hypothetical protein